MGDAFRLVNAKANPIFSLSTIDFNKALKVLLLPENAWKPEGKS